MKNILMAGLLFALSGCMNWRLQKSSVTNQSDLPVMLLESEQINYGAIEFDSNGGREVRFKNTGKQPLIIITACSACGGLVPMYPKKPIGPGEISTIRIHYETKRMGAFEKTITFTTNAKNPTTRLHVSGEVLKPNS